MCYKGILLWIVGYVIVHHNNNLLIRNPMILGNLVGMADISLKQKTYMNMTIPMGQEKIMAGNLFKY